MKYGELTLGQIEAIVNKLGGIEGAQSFLRGESVLKMVERVFPIWKTINLGTHKDADALKEALREADFQTLPWAADMMESPLFTLEKEERALELVVASVRELGFDDGAHYDAICSRIRELGYELCLAEVGPQLRLQYPDQPEGEWQWLYIAMDPITVSGCGLCVFRLALGHDALGHDGRWLEMYGVGPGVVLGPGARFVFARPKTIPTS